MLGLTLSRSKANVASDATWIVLCDVPGLHIALTDNIASKIWEKGAHEICRVRWSSRDPCWCPWQCSREGRFKENNLGCKSWIIQERTNVMGNLKYPINGLGTWCYSNRNTIGNNCYVKRKGKCIYYDPCSSSNLPPHICQSFSGHHFCLHTTRGTNIN